MPENVLDIKRARLEAMIHSDATPEEVELAETLLDAYDGGEIDILTDVATGELLFTLAQVH